jgi:hypothetical protein
MPMIDYDIDTGTDDQDEYSLDPLKRFLRTAGANLPGPPYDMGQSVPTSKNAALDAGVTVEPTVSKNEAADGAHPLSGVSPVKQGIKTTIPIQAGGYSSIAGGRLMVPDSSGPAIDSSIHPVDADVAANAQRTATSGDFLNTERFTNRPAVAGGPGSPSATVAASPRAGIGQRLNTLTAPTESAGEVADQAHLRDTMQPLDRSDPKYKLGGWGRVGRIALDLASGGVPGVARGGLDPNAPGYYGPRAVNNQYSRDEAARQRDIEATQGRLKSYEDESKHAQSTFSDEYKLQHDDELNQARQENADTRKSLAQARQNAIDKGSFYKGDDGNYYGYALGDTERKNPIKVIPSQVITAQNRLAQTPKTYDQAVIAWASETDPQKKAQLKQAMDQIIAGRRSVHAKAAAKAPDIPGLTPEQNRLVKAQLIPVRDALGIVRARMRDALPKEQGALQQSADELNRQAQKIVEDARQARVTAQPKGSRKGTQLTDDEARDYLKRAGGDKNKARKMATQDDRKF